jgi:hypothetical protein
MTKPTEGTIRLNVNVEESVHSAFKAACALQGKRMTELLIKFMKQYVQEHPLSGPRKGGSRGIRK